MSGDGLDDPDLTWQAWNLVFRHELTLWSVLAILNLFQQVLYFFLLMLSGPGISNPNTDFCSSLRYISENLAVLHGLASYLVFLWILQWIVLAVISTQRHALLNRHVALALASLSYIGVLMVVLYHQNSATENLHLLGAVLMILPVLLMQFLIADAAFDRVHRKNSPAPRTVQTIYPFVAEATVFLIFLTIILGLTYCFLYLLHYWGYSFVCMSVVVLLEYIVYFLVVINSFVVYLDFTMMHTFHKLKNQPHSAIQ